MTDNRPDKNLTRVVLVLLFSQLSSHCSDETPGDDKEEIRVRLADILVHPTR